MMFENLTENLGRIFDQLTKRGVLRESDVDMALREVRVALLDADVALSVVKELVSRVRERAVGADGGHCGGPHGGGGEAA